MDDAVSPTTASALPDAEAFREEPRRRLRIPFATYRLQLQPAFLFRDAAAVVPYLARLGVSDCYCSPYLFARPGSTHGYDICDYGRLNPELGGEEGFEAFTAALAAHGMGVNVRRTPLRRSGTLLSIDKKPASV